MRLIALAQELHQERPTDTDSEDYREAEGSDPEADAEAPGGPAAGPAAAGFTIYG